MPISAVFVGVSFDAIYEFLNVRNAHFSLDVRHDFLPFREPFREGPGSLADLLQASIFRQNIYVQDISLVVFLHCSAMYVSIHLSTIKNKRLTCQTLCSSIYFFQIRETFRQFFIDSLIFRQFHVNFCDFVLWRDFSRSTKKQIKRIKETKQIISKNLKSAKTQYFVDLLFRLSKKQIKLDRLSCVSSKKADQVTNVFVEFYWKSRSDFLLIGKGRKVFCISYFNVSLLHLYWI